MLSWFCENRSTDVGCVSATVLYSKLIRLDEIAFRQSKRENEPIYFSYLRVSYRRPYVRLCDNVRYNSKEQCALK